MPSQHLRRSQQGLLASDLHSAPMHHVRVASADEGQRQWERKNRHFHEPWTSREVQAPGQPNAPRPPRAPREITLRAPTPLFFFQGAIVSSSVCYSGIHSYPGPFSSERRSIPCLAHGATVHRRCAPHRQGAGVHHGANQTIAECRLHPHLPICPSVQPPIQPSLSCCAGVAPHLLLPWNGNTATRQPATSHTWRFAIVARHGAFHASSCASTNLLSTMALCARRSLLWPRWLGRCAAPRRSVAPIAAEIALAMSCFMPPPWPQSSDRPRPQ